MDFLQDTQKKPLSTLSAFSYIPPQRKVPRELSYFNRDSKVSDISIHDRVLHQDEGYDNKLPREDRKHWEGRGLNIYQEERSRAVPVLSSSVYGRRSVPAIYQTGRRYARVACIKPEFYRKSGIIWNVAEGYGSVLPL